MGLDDVDDDDYDEEHYFHLLHPCTPCRLPERFNGANQVLYGYSFLFFSFLFSSILFCFLLFTQFGFNFCCSGDVMRDSGRMKHQDPPDGGLCIKIVSQQNSCMSTSLHSCFLFFIYIFIYYYLFFIHLLLVGMEECI